MYRQIKFSIWFPIILVTAFAAGYLFWQKTLIPGPYDLKPVNIIRNNNSNLPRDEVLRGWQTYRNEEYGFEFNYTRLLVYEEKNLDPLRNFIALKYPYDKETCFQLGYFGCPIEIEIRQNIMGMNEQDIFSEYFPQDKKVGLVQDIYLGNKPAKLIINNQDLSKSIITKTNGYTLRITLIRADQLVEAPQIETEAFDQILSTFKFLTTETQKGQENRNGGGVCIQVITRARNPQTGEVRDFPTPCDVPEGWEKIK